MCQEQVCLYQLYFPILSDLKFYHLSYFIDISAWKVTLLTQQLLLKLTLLHNKVQKNCDKLSIYNDQYTQHVRVIQNSYTGLST